MPTRLKDLIGFTWLSLLGVAGQTMAQATIVVVVIHVGGRFSSKPNTLVSVQII